MPDEARSERLRRGLRQYKGERLRRPHADILAQSVGMEVEEAAFLDVDETKAILKRFVVEIHAADARARLQAADVEYCSWPAQDHATPAQLAGRLQVVGHSWAGKLVLLLPKQDLTGAIELPGDVILANVLPLSEAMAEIHGARFDIRAITHDASSGLSWAFNYYDRRDEYVRDGVWEMLAWGLIGSNLRLTR